MKPDYLLTFESEPDGNVIHVHADSSGLAKLIRILGRLKDRLDGGEHDHVHLMTDDWGGSELSSEIQDLSGETTLVHHVKLHGWTRTPKKDISDRDRDAPCLTLQ
jgi:hypothetical protein